MYRAWGQVPIGVLVVYAILLLLVLFVILPREPPAYDWVVDLLVVVIVFLVVRTLSTRYAIDDTALRATRILGGSRLALDEIRRIEYSALRDLAPSGAMAGVAGWGWHGRMWSPVVGSFDSIFTDPARGLLISGTDHLLFISPTRVDAFARELSRRVRSYTGPLDVDVGHPGARGDAAQ